MAACSVLPSSHFFGCLFDALIWPDEVVSTAVCVDRMNHVIEMNG